MLLWFKYRLTLCSTISWSQLALSTAHRFRQKTMLLGGCSTLNIELDLFSANFSNSINDMGRVILSTEIANIVRTGKDSNVFGDLPLAPKTEVLC